MDADLVLKHNISKTHVSIIIPVFNGEKYICDTLRSVSNQTYAHYEIIVVDDCSTDNTENLISQMMLETTRIRFLKTHQNSGTPAGPRNLGIREAAYDWIAFVDADDIWHPRKLELQMFALAETNAQFCCSRMKNFSALSDLVFSEPVSGDFEKIDLQKQLIKFRTPTSSVVVSRELVKNNMFNEDIRFKAREDLDCWLRCLEDTNYAIKIKSILVGYRVSENQISVNKRVIIRRHLLVLKEFKFKNGKKLGYLSYFYTFTHIILSIYYRIYLKEL